MSFRLGRLLSGVTAAAVATTIVGCSATKLTDPESVSSALNLTDGQTRIVRPNIGRIAAAVEDYEEDKDALVEEMQSLRPAGGRGGGRGGGGFPGGGGRGAREAGAGMDARRSEMQERMKQFNAKRVAYQLVIDTAIAAVVAVLDERQRDDFAKIDKPELTPPELRSQGGGGRGGRGGGGGGRGGGFR